MDASFHKRRQITQLPEHKLFTISPSLLTVSPNHQDDVPGCLSTAATMHVDLHAVALSGFAFHRRLKEDAIAKEKPAQLIRRFAANPDKLRTSINEELTKTSV